MKSVLYQTFRFSICVLLRLHSRHGSCSVPTSCDFRSEGRKWSQRRNGYNVAAVLHLNYPGRECALAGGLRCKVPQSDRAAVYRHYKCSSNSALHEQNIIHTFSFTASAYVHVIRVLRAEINCAARAHHSSPPPFFSTHFFHPLVKKSSVSEYITRSLGAHTRPRTLYNTHPLTRSHTLYYIIYVVCRPRERGERWYCRRCCRDFVDARPRSPRPTTRGIENRNNCASWRVAVGRVRGIFTSRKRALSPLLRSYRTSVIYIHTYRYIVAVVESALERFFLYFNYAREPPPAIAVTGTPTTAMTRCW